MIFSIIENVHWFNLTCFENDKNLMKLNHFIHAMILDIIRHIVGITIKIHSKHPQVNKGV